MLALGSGSPTRAICSTLIAQAFQSVHYPILPRIQKTEEGGDGHLTQGAREVLHVRHFSLFTPRDFDISPYFRILKPEVECGFDYQTLPWSEGSIGEPVPVTARGFAQVGDPDFSAL